ncbi:MAG: hypothetical protein KDK07_25300 [Bauldia sp.]|nr:hypothetical protein [Bauldia sp.]
MGQLASAQTEASEFTLGGNVLPDRLLVYPEYRPTVCIACRAYLGGRPGPE